MKDLRKHPRYRKLWQKSGVDKNTCNLCKQEFTDLSEDHVPPHAVQKIMDVSIDPNSIMGSDEKGTFSQEGIKFKTICTPCNNTLGHQYDNKLAHFIRRVEAAYEAEVFAPHQEGRVVQVDADVDAVIRSLCGHLVAAKIQLDEVTMDEAIRKFVFDRSLGIPESINIYYWLYPHYEVRIKRDFGILSPRDGHQSNIGSILKFYPLAFFFTDSSRFMGFPNLRSYLTADGTPGKVPIHFREIEHKAWPEGGRKEGLAEAILDGRAGSEAIIGNYRPKKPPKS